MCKIKKRYDKERNDEIKKQWKILNGLNDIEEKKNMENTNYEKVISLKKEYEDLKKQLENIKGKMLSVKQKAKNELNWIMNDQIDT